MRRLCNQAAGVAACFAANFCLFLGVLFLFSLLQSQKLKLALESYDVGPYLVYFSVIYFESHLLVGFLNLDSLFLGNLGQLGVGVGFM
jgi:hypothetical protein